MSTIEPGMIVLLGSGETQPSGGKTHEYVANAFSERPHIVILEIAGDFRPNSEPAAGDVFPSMRRRLRNSEATVAVVPARCRRTPHTLDDPEIVAPILNADEIWLRSGNTSLGSSGSGSPTHAASQLRDTLALQMITARQRRGAALVLSSMAALAFGTYTLPVNEIYEAGANLHWKQGLDYFGQYGLPFSVVPHWNNGDGGDDEDTSRCYLGWERFRRLHAMLPSEHPILGIDEHTALIVDFARGSGYVHGEGSVTFLRKGINHRLPAGAAFPLGLLGFWQIPSGRASIPQTVWDQALRAEFDNSPAAVT